MKAFSGPITDPADVEYVRSVFCPLEALATEYGHTLEEVRRRIDAGELPNPTYALEDGTAYVPRSYFAEACSFDEFRRRLTHAAARKGIPFTEQDVRETWNSHLTGVFGVCLRAPSPETMIEKSWLMEQIDSLTAAPRPDDTGWRSELESFVNALDLLEAAFTLFDRKSGPVSRERYIENARTRYNLAAMAEQIQRDAVGNLIQKPELDNAEGVPL